MKSPFPGMDPYLEQHWSDVHARLILYACDQLQDRLPRSLVARVEERIVLEVDDDDVRQRRPDVRIVERPVIAGGDQGVAVAAPTAIRPVTVHIDDEPRTETFVEIHDTQQRRVVTVIEFLSETNKLPGESLRQYREKPVELLRGRVSLVEIDLNRSGKRSLVWRTRRFPKETRTVYQAVVRRGWTPKDLDVYPIPLRQALPSIDIPLRESDQTARLDLQPLIDQAYRKGRYADTIDYRQPPEPPLDGADAAWANALLKNAGKR